MLGWTPYDLCFIWVDCCAGEMMKMSVKVFMVYLWLVRDAKHRLLVMAPLTWPCVESFRVALSVTKPPFWLVLWASVAVMSVLLHEPMFTVSRVIYGSSPSPVHVYHVLHQLQWYIVDRILVEYITVIRWYIHTNTLRVSWICCGMFFFFFFFFLN